MIDHFGINCRDLEASARFYDAVLEVLGHRRLMDVGVAIGYGTDKPDFWISGGEAASGPNREIHVGVHRRQRRHGAPVARHRARARRRVAARASAVAGVPRGLLRRFVRDPDGNNVEAVCHRGEG